MATPENADSPRVSHGHLYHNLAVPGGSPSKSAAASYHNTSGNNYVSDQNSSMALQNGTKDSLASSGANEVVRSLGSASKNSSSDLMSTQRPRKQKICSKCQKPIIGNLVRALDAVYHVDCFTCYDCGKQCYNKFFSMDLPSSVDPNKLVASPLCEYDYFKRLDVICYLCDSAIRGSYITALGHKYHPEHFYCDICHKLFDSDDYYSNNDKIYCHYHYSQLYAFKCAGCHSAILKQYVELHRGDIDQQWHPECFMVHKFWNIDITVDYVGLGLKSLDNVRNSKSSDALLKAENSLEKLTVDIWCTLSEFEESCAYCISEMLHSATTFEKDRAIACAAHLVLKIETLFKAIDSVQRFTKKIGINLPVDDSNKNNIQLNTEPRLLSSKILHYLTFSREITPEKLNDTKNSQDLLSLISALAHYIKLISRTGILMVLEANKLANSVRPTDIFLREISLSSKVNRDETSKFPYLEGMTPRTKDSCESCHKSIEEGCAAWYGNIGGTPVNKRWHFSCLSCSKCRRSIQPTDSLKEIGFNVNKNAVLCASCASQDVDAVSGFKDVSKLLQLVFILKIALLRSRIALSKSQAETPKKSLLINDDYDKQVNDITRRRSIREGRELQNANQEIQKFKVVGAPVGNAAGVSQDANTASDGEDKLGRLNSTKRYLSRHGSAASSTNKQGINIQVDGIPTANALMTSKMLLNEKSLTLDDIPRIVSTEQAREYRPNAFRYQKRNFSPAFANLPKSKSVNKHENTFKEKPKVLNDNDNTPLEQIDNDNNNDKETKLEPVRRYSDLNAIGHDYIRHISAFVLYDLLKDQYNISLENCLSIVAETKKSSSSSSFWGKLFGSKDKERNTSNTKEFKSGSATTSVTGNGVFGSPLETVVKNYGTDSDLGVGESRLRIPSLVDELIHAMKKQNLSAEGVFRLNGNIKRLRTLVEELDGKHGKPDAVLQKMKLSEETPIQLAAILKKFLRDLPDPLMTFKLYDIFILSQGGSATEASAESLQKEKILKIAYSLLPKANRDLAEVLLSFLAWVATFAYLEEGDGNSGSKMDTHNLATVLTPNILYQCIEVVKPTPFSLINQNNGFEQSQFLAIEVIHEMIQNNDDMSVIPSGVYKIFTMAGFDKSPGVKINGIGSDLSDKKSILSSKEIVAKVKTIVDSNPGILGKAFE